jgi:hypothetical protein
LPRAAGGLRTGKTQYRRGPTGSHALNESSSAPSSAHSVFPHLGKFPKEPDTRRLVSWGKLYAGCSRPILGKPGSWRPRNTYLRAQETRKHIYRAWEETDPVRPSPLLAVGGIPQSGTIFNHHVCAGWTDGAFMQHRMPASPTPRHSPSPRGPWSRKPGGTRECRRGQYDLRELG